jgi:uncharacterized SAM-binding protein YcdF (DUF218 family)
MSRQRRQFRKAHKVLIGFGLLFIITLILLLRHAGTYLVKQTDPLPKSDAAVILMGSIADRVLEAADVYKDGLTDRIVIVNNIQYGSESLEPYGVSIPNFASLSVDALIQLGVPDSLITVLPGRASSTRAEADTISSWLKVNPGTDTLAIISSSAHTRRAFMIFDDSFSDNEIDITLITVPSKYSEFTGERWWSDRESAKQLFMEWVKIVSFVLVEKWK